MTEEQIVKALECSPLNDIGGCRKIDALNLIKSKNAEIERLEKMLDCAVSSERNAVDSILYKKSEAIKEFAEKVESSKHYG